MKEECGESVIPARENGILEGMANGGARPYDMRWGTILQVKRNFGITAAAIKSAWVDGHVRARQGNWKNDRVRTQTVFCFEDIHRWLERTAHVVSKEYAETWWTDKEIFLLSEKKARGKETREQARGHHGARCGGGTRQDAASPCGDGEGTRQDAASPCGGSVAGAGGDGEGTRQDAASPYGEKNRI